MKRRLRVGVFPRGLDGLFLPDDRHEIVWLLERGRPEERWAARAQHKAVASFTLGRPRQLAELTTSEALEHSDLAHSFRSSSLDALFLHSSRSPESDAWAKQQRLPLCAVTRRWAYALEHKIAFDRLLETQRIPRPRSLHGRAARLDPLPFKAGAVVQKPESMGGEGTFFLKPGQAVRELIVAGSVRPDERCLVREHVEGRALGITILVAHEHVALSAVRTQCYQPLAQGATRRVFAGIQWLPRAELDEAVVAAIEHVFTRLGKRLHTLGFRGFANCDFIVTKDGQVRVIECNPRPSAATPCLSVWPELIHGLPVGELLLDALLRRRDARQKPRSWAMPDSRFAGATLDLTAGADHEPPRRVLKSVEIGVYRFEGELLTYLAASPRALGPKGTLFVYCPVRRGERYAADTTLVNVLSSERLYDGHERLNARGQRLRRCLEVT